MGAHCQHHHGDLKGRRLMISIVLNSIVTLAQVVGGLYSGSLSLLSDALHNLSDVISLFISYLANRLASRKYTPQQTFGFKRSEIVAALINGITLVGVAGMLLKEAVFNLRNPVSIDSNIVIGLAILGIAANGFSVLLLKQDAHNNLNIRSAYLHLLTDMMTSVAVMVGGFMMKYWQFYWVDSLLSILIAIYLVYSSWSLIVSTLKVLMQFSPDTVDVENVAARIKEVSGIKGVHHVHVWSLNDDEIHFEAHIDFEEDLRLSDTNTILDQVRIVLNEYKITHSSLQAEYNSSHSNELIADEHHTHSHHDH